MELKAYPLVPTDDAPPAVDATRIQGMIQIPQGSKIVHIGAIPPRGELMAYCEVSPVAAPMEKIDVVVLKENDVIPNGYIYLGYILAVPIIFIYRRKPGGILLGH